VAHANFTGTNKNQVVCMHKRLTVKGVLKCLLKEGVTQLVKVTYGSWKKRNKEPPKKEYIFYLINGLVPCIANKKC
jgi:hypothetical protein